MAEFDSAINAEIYHGDALQFLEKLESGSAHLIFLDPPFNLGKRYGRGAFDALPPAAYAEWMTKVLAECVRALAEGGALYLYHLPSWAIQFAAFLGQQLAFRHWIAISMKNGFARGARLYPAHYALLYYTKGVPQAFKRPKIPVDVCECGRYKKDYGGYLEIVRRQGINLSDVWDDVSPVRHKNFKKRTANELPMRITDRITAISGAVGLLFVDPFAGSGSSLVSAAKLGMRIKACDVVRSNCRIQVGVLDSLQEELEEQ